MGDAPTPSDALQALERFVVDNDDLLALEARIGRFNVFDALGVARRELQHSNFLAWLLDPAESHGQGPLFLKAVLMDLLKRAGEEGVPRALSPVQLDGTELRGVEVRREWRSIDLLITCREPPFVVAVENKVDSGEHGDQLDRYERVVREHYPGLAPQFVYLTREGGEASDDDWLPYSYADLHRVLTRVRAANARGIGDDVLAFLDHYLNLIGTRFMDDPTIDDLCQRIYKNHRQAIELIVERIASPRAQAVGVIREAVAQRPEWRLLKATGRVVEVRPVEWEGLLPPIALKAKYSADCWMFLQFVVHTNRCTSALRLTPVSDVGCREMVLRRLAQDPKEFGLKSLFKDLSKLGTKWATIGRQRVLDWSASEEPDAERLSAAVVAELDKRRRKLAGLPDALRPIIAEWEAKRAPSA